MNPPSNQGHALSRRQLLQASGIGALNLAFPGMVTASVDADRPLGSGAAEKSCIFLWLCGGPSHLDTWDLKPDAPEDIRGPYRPIATTVPGHADLRAGTRSWPSWPSISPSSAR